MSTAHPWALSPEQAARDLGRDVAAAEQRPPLRPGVRVLVGAWRLAREGSK